MLTESQKLDIQNDIKTIEYSFKWQTPDTSLEENVELEMYMEYMADANFRDSKTKFVFSSDDVRAELLKRDGKVVLPGYTDIKFSNAYIQKEPEKLI